MNFKHLAFQRFGRSDRDDRYFLPCYTISKSIKMLIVGSLQSDIRGHCDTYIAILLLRRILKYFISHNIIKKFASY